MTVYPIEIDSAISIPVATDAISAVNAATVNRLRDAIIAIESELGVNPATIYTTVRTRLDNMDAVLEVLNDNGSLFSAGGDLDGDGLDQTVIGLQGRPLNATVPATDQVISWDGYAWTPTTFNSFSAGGDLTGTASSQTVAKVNGITISGTPAIGNSLHATSASAGSWSSLNLAGGANYVTGALPAANQASQTMLGDVTGTTAAAVVAKVNGITITGTPAIGNSIHATSTSAGSWSALNLAGGADYITGVLPTANQASQTMLGDVTGTTASSVVAKINGATVSAAGALTTNHVLKVSGASATTYGYVVNANIDSAAAIDYSKFGSGTQSLAAQQFSSTVDTKGTLVDVQPKNVQTTDATATTIDSFTIASNTTLIVTTVITAVKSDNTQGAAYFRTAAFRNNAGTVAQISTTQDGGTFEDDSSWDVTVDNVTTTVRIRVTGKAATTIRWTCVSTRLEVIV